jgi:hypothetical protein
MDNGLRARLRNACALLLARKPLLEPEKRSSIFLELGFGVRSGGFCHF